VKTEHKKEIEKMRRNLRREIRGMSIVISTVIIVAISITMAIAVGFWAMGIGNSFTKFEKLEFVSIYSDPPAGNRFNVYIQLKNTGTAAATINNIFLDGRPYSAPTAGGTVSQNLVGLVLSVGQRYNNGLITLPNGGTWNSGDYVEIEIETTAGRTYSNTVALP
jgi:archaeal type IV pilus assembly protein PilA